MGNSEAALRFCCLVFYSALVSPWLGYGGMSTANAGRARANHMASRRDQRCSGPSR